MLYTTLVVGIQLHQKFMDKHFTQLVPFWNLFRLRLPCRGMKTIHDPRYARTIQWLISARQERNLTVRQLAQRIGHTHSWVVKVENLDKKLDVLEFIDFCKALDVDPQSAFAQLLDDSAG